jgi:mevalonate pyrophosphate decarboxylase
MVTVQKGYREEEIPLSLILAKTNIRVESINNFATAAGLASSASGLACLARCLAAVYGL